MSDDNQPRWVGYAPSNTPKSERQKMAKEIRKTIRFTEDEYAKIQQELDKANISFSVFARVALLHKKIKLPIERELLTELSRIGNNLNQIARSCNQGEKKPVLLELVEIEKQLKELKNGR